MNDYTSAGSQLVSNDMNDVAEHVGFALRVIGASSTNQILELHRA